MPFQKDFWEDPPMFENPWTDPPIEFFPPVNVIGEPEPPMEPMPYPTIPQLPPMADDPFAGLDSNAIIRLLQSGGNGAISLLQRFLGSGGGGGTSGGGGDPLGFINRLIGGGSGMGSNILENPMLIPSLISAMQQWKDSDRYMDLSNEWAQQADPFGPERPGYQNQLRSLMTDPESYLKNDPAYQSTLRLAMNPVQSMMRSKGYGNSGNILSELTRVAGDTTNKYIGELRDDLGHFSGAQFGPDTAARLRQGGLDASVRSRNGALDALMYPFLATAFNRQGQPGQTQPGGGNGGNGFNWSDILGSMQPPQGQTPGYNNITDPSGYQTPYNPDNPYDPNGL